MRYSSKYDPWIGRGARSIITRPNQLFSRRLQWGKRTGSTLALTGLISSSVKLRFQLLFRRRFDRSLKRDTYRVVSVTVHIYTPSVSSDAFKLKELSFILYLDSLFLNMLSSLSQFLKHLTGIAPENDQESNQPESSTMATSTAAHRCLLVS